MSFVDQDDVLDAISEAVLAAAEAVDRRAPRPDRADHVARGDGPLRRRQARPALRHGARSSSPTCSPAPSSRRSPAPTCDQGHQRVRARPSEYGRNKLDKLTDRAKRSGAKGLVWLKVAADGTFESPVAKFLSDDEQRRCSSRLARGRRRPAADRRRRVGRPPARCSARCATTSAARRCTRARTATCGSSTSRCSSASTRRPGSPKPGHHPFMPAAPRRPRPVRDRSDVGALAWPTTSCSTAGSSVRARSGSTSPSCSAGSSPRSASATRRPTRKFGFFLNPFELRRTAARRVRVRHRPARRDPRRRGEHPRGHRLPEDAVGHRPDDQLARRRSIPSSSPSSVCGSCPWSIHRRAAATHLLRLRSTIELCHEFAIVAT